MKRWVVLTIKPCGRNEFSYDTVVGPFDSMTLALDFINKTMKKLPQHYFKAMELTDPSRPF